MNLPSLDWFAGFFDGEGSIGLYWNKGSKDSRYRSGHKTGCWIRSVTILHTHRPTLLLWKQRFGGRVAINRIGKGTHKTTWVWTVGSVLYILWVLDSLIPKLREKKPQAEVMRSCLRGTVTHEKAARMLKRLKHVKLA